jgi:hypothetical protein
MTGDTTQKRRANFDWQLCQSEAEWEAANQARQPLASRPRSPLRRLLPVGIGLTLLLAAGGLRWYSVQTERAAVEAALVHTVEAEAQAGAPSVDPLVTSSPTAGRAFTLPPVLGPNAQGLTSLAQFLPYGDAITRLRRIDGDVAVVEVVLPGSQDQPALRQTRVYRQTGSDWVRIDPAAAYWGAFNKWTGEQLVFRYYADDAEAVAEVAAPLDARYGELHQLVLGEPPSHKLTMVVDPAQAPSEVAHRASSIDPLVVASPAVYLTPETISDAELLAQSLLLALLDDLTDQALRRYDADSIQEQILRTRVDQLLDGVALWQVWQGELPLARWREPVVQWVFSDARPSAPAPGEVIPSFREELCAMHRLWLPTTLALDLPLTCNDTWDSGRGRYLSWRRIAAPPQRLADLSLMTVEMVLVDFTVSSESVHPAAEVALATVMEYAAATYGPEQIPILIEEAGQQEGWATLIPAVFAVSAEEFEAGWQTYLATHYGIVQ